MNNLAHTTEIVTGFILPPIVSVIVQSHWSRQTKGAVSAAVMLAAAAMTAYSQGAWDSGNMIVSVFYVMATAITSYRGLWEPTGAAKAIQDATTPDGEK